MAKDTPDTIKITHERSPHYGSYVATGCFISGPAADGLYHIQFHRDATNICEEIGTKKEGNTYSLTINTDKIQNIREVQARISLSGNALKLLLKGIEEHLKSSNQNLQ